MPVFSWAYPGYPRCRPVVLIVFVGIALPNEASVPENLSHGTEGSHLTNITNTKKALRVSGHYGHYHWKEKLNCFNKIYVQRWLIAGENFMEPELIVFYRKMELKQAIMLVESGQLPSALPSMVSMENIQPRATPRLSKKREEEIRRILRSNLQNNKQRMCSFSYSRHTLFDADKEDNVSQVHLRKMERRMSHYLTVPANWESPRPGVRRFRFESNNQVFSADSVPTIHFEQPSTPRTPDTVSLEEEVPKRGNLKADGGGPRGAVSDSSRES